MTPLPDAPDREAPPGLVSRSPAATWLKRFGLAGFLFFLGKGLLWLALPALIVAFGKGC